jgi:hypothetical protein
MKVTDIRARRRGWWHRWWIIYRRRRGRRPTRINKQILSRRNLSRRSWRHRVTCVRRMAAGVKRLLFMECSFGAAGTRGAKEARPERS